MSFTLVKKLSSKTVVSNIKALIKEMKSGEKVDLYTVVGIASGTKTGDTDFGTWVSLTGRFEAVNTATGDAYRSANLFLPDVANDLVVASLEGENVEAVEIAFNVSLVVDETIQVGYRYEASPLMEVAEDDPISRLTAKVLKALPKPDAPAKAEKPASKPSTAK